MVILDSSALRKYCSNTSVYSVAFEGMSLFCLNIKKNCTCVISLSGDGGLLLLSNIGWPRTHLINQTSLELATVIMFLPTREYRQEPPFLTTWL